MVNPLKQLEERRRIDAAFKRVAASPEGMVMLMYLFQNGFGMTTTYVAGDHNQTVMNEGARRFMLSILKKCNVSEQQIFQNIEEVYRELG